MELVPPSQVLPNASAEAQKAYVESDLTKKAFLLTKTMLIEAFGKYVSFDHSHISVVILNRNSQLQIRRLDISREEVEKKCRLRSEETSLMLSLLNKFLLGNLMAGVCNKVWFILHSSACSWPKFQPFFAGTAANHLDTS